MTCKDCDCLEADNAALRNLLTKAEWYNDDDGTHCHFCDASPFLFLHPRFVLHDPDCPGAKLRGWRTRVEDK